MKNRLIKFVNGLQGFVNRHALAALMLAFMLFSALGANATDYDPAALTTGIGTLFQGAIAVSAVIISTLMGIRVVKKAIGAA